MATWVFSERKEGNGSGHRQSYSHSTEEEDDDGLSAILGSGCSCRRCHVSRYCIQICSRCRLQCHVTHAYRTYYVCVVLSSCRVCHVHNSKLFVHISALFCGRFGIVCIVGLSVTVATHTHACLMATNAAIERMFHQRYN